MKYLLLVSMSALMAVPQLLARSPVSPKPVRIVAGCFTVNNKRVCPPNLRQLVMHDDVFILRGGNIVNHVQCQSHLHSQVPGHAIHCIGQPGGGHQQVGPGTVPGINPGQQNPVGGTPGVSTIFVP